MHTVPPELLTEDGLEARAAELQRRISREWLRYAVIEGLAIGVPFFVFLAVYIGSDLSKTALIVAAGLGTAAWVVCTVYWLFVRVRPLQRELESLQRALAR